MAGSLSLRIAIWVLAVAAALGLALALTLWLLARPVLAAAAGDYAERALCEGTTDGVPTGYPKALREKVSFASVEGEVLQETCRRHGIANCHHRARNPLIGVGRVVGFRLYQRAYLSECQLRAITLREDMALGRALHRLYPGQDPATLDSAQLKCVGAVLWAGWSARAEKLGDCTLPRPPAAQRPAQ